MLLANLFWLRLLGNGWHTIAPMLISDDGGLLCFASLDIALNIHYAFTQCAGADIASEHGPRRRNTFAETIELF